MRNCTIENGTILLNGDIIFSEKATSFSEFAKKALKSLKIDYPKFFKMDNLSKLAFLATEVLLRDFSQEEKDKISIVFANKSSSLDTDLKHQESINNKKNYYPSPAVFVYTLPNICLGEIAIRHQMKTESAFFIFEKYPEDFFKNYSKELLKNNSIQKVLCGWVDFLGDNYKANLQLIGN